MGNRTVAPPSMGSSRLCTFSIVSLSKLPLPILVLQSEYIADRDSLRPPPDIVDLPRPSPWVWGAGVHYVVFHCCQQLLDFVCGELRFGFGFGHLMCERRGSG
jgi:hypothetical protein